MKREQAEPLKSCETRERAASHVDVQALRQRRTCSVEEAATLLGVGRSTAYAAARDGSLPTVRIFP